MASQLLGLAEESGPSPGESELAVNPFDGLPFSSRYYELLEQRRALPIWATRFIFLEQLESSPSGVVLVSGEPGSGKSTQIPQWCAEFALARGFKEGRVTVTQPYPLAALSLAVRVADEMDLTLGQEVGYSIPQEDCTGPDTLLRFCWDRLLLQEVASTRGTGAWGVLVLDEAQERSVASDLLQGLLRNAKLGNLPGDSRVVVVTDPALEPKLQAFWGNPTIVHVPRGPGACPTPVYRDIVPTDRVEAACQAVLELCAKEAPGDVLVYLPSEEVKMGCRRRFPCMPPSFPGGVGAMLVRNIGVVVFTMLESLGKTQRFQGKEVYPFLNPSNAETVAQSIPEIIITSWEYAFFQSEKP